MAKTIVAVQNEHWGWNLLRSISAFAAIDGITRGYNGAVKSVWEQETGANRNAINDASRKEEDSGGGEKRSGGEAEE